MWVGLVYKKLPRMLSCPQAEVNVGEGDSSLDLSEGSASDRPQTQVLYHFVFTQPCLKCFYEIQTDTELLLRAAPLQQEFH